MKSLHESYINCFRNFARVTLDKSTCFKEIVPFANSLNEKANQLLMRASVNGSADTKDLQRDLFETGRDYIHKFANKFNQNKVPDIVGVGFKL